jgi:hypothetical protein
MKLDYPYKTATVEEGATLVPRPDLLRCSSFPYKGLEGVLPNADRRDLRSGGPQRLPGYRGLAQLRLRILSRHSKLPLKYF